MPDPDPGRVVVLTGANEGIGYHMLRTLLEDGYRVAALDVEVANLDPLADTYGDRLRVYDCDVTEDADVESAVEDVLDAWGYVDVLVNNAAMFNFGLVRDRSLADTREEFEVNVFGPLRLVHAVLPHMRERGEGKVHFVSSGVGRVGNPGLSGYGATKGALEAYARSLRLELQLESVSCTVMHPSLASTRSAMELGYPASTMDDPADVGRKLARKVESTNPVVYADWKTRIGLAVAERFPGLVKRATRRFLDALPAPTEPEGATEPASTATEDESAGERTQRTGRSARTGGDPNDARPSSGTGAEPAAGVDETRLVADLDDGVVVYINGMRLNELRALPQYLLAGLKAGKMFERLEADPDSGFLGYQPALMGLRHGAAIQYWRSLEDLHRFARERDDLHVPAWRWYDERGNAEGGLGLWSETYVVDADHVETFFRNVPAVGIGEFVDRVPASERPRRLGMSPTGDPATADQEAVGEQPTPEDIDAPDRRAERDG